MSALGNYSGGLLAVFINVSGKTLRLALHHAEGIIIAVVGIELMPNASFLIRLRLTFFFGRVF